MFLFEKKKYTLMKMKIFKISKNDFISFTKLSSPVVEIIV